MGDEQGRPAARKTRPRTSSQELLHRGRSGDSDAINRLFERYLPTLCRWAHRRVPPWARGMNETADLVQDVALKAFRHLGSFEPQQDQALLRYLRRSLVNRIRDQVRIAMRRPAGVPLDDEQPDDTPSQLRTVIDSEDRERYLRALKRLRAADRNAIVARLELGYSYEQLALVLRKPSEVAARLAVRRALERLAKGMARE